MFFGTARISKYISYNSLITVLCDCFRFGVPYSIWWLKSILSNNILTVFIPLPKNVSRGDQIENVKYIQNQNLCTSIMQENLTFEKQQNKLKFLKNNAILIKNSIKSANFKDGTKNIIDIILKEKST